jgi:hypothetical protein
MNHRASVRKRVLRPATIEIDGGGAISCVARNLSNTGAMLDVESPFGIPERFILILGDGHQIPCRVAWRKPKRIGVAFE